MNNYKISGMKNPFKQLKSLSLLWRERVREREREREREMNTESTDEYRERDTCPNPL